MTQTVRDYAEHFAANHGGIASLRKTSSYLNNFSGTLSYTFSCNDNSIVLMTWIKGVDGKYGSEPVFDIIRAGQASQIIYSAEAYCIANDMNRMARIDDLVEATRKRRDDARLSSDYAESARYLLSMGGISYDEYSAICILGLDVAE